MWFRYSHVGMNFVGAPLVQGATHLYGYLDGENSGSIVFLIWLLFQVVLTTRIVVRVLYTQCCRVCPKVTPKVIIVGRERPVGSPRPQRPFRGPQGSVRPVSPTRQRGTVEA